MREEVPERAEPRSATGEAQEGVQSHSRGPGGKGCSGDNLARFRNREERDGYMDSLARQMEREQIQHTLDRMAEDSDRRRKAIEKLWSALPSFLGLALMWGAAERETPTEPIGSETPSAREESPRKPFEPRSWRRMFGAGRWNRKTPRS